MSVTDSHDDLARTSNRSARRQELAKTIKKELRSNAIQHPTTLLPLTAGILALIYQQFFSQRFGGAGWALVVFLASSAGAIGSFLWHYIIHFPAAFSQKARELQERQEAEERAEAQQALQQQQARVKQGFDSLNFTQGLQALQELEQEYQALQTALEQEQGLEYVSLSDIRALTAQTYQQGLSVLDDAAELAQVIASMDKPKLEREAQRLKREIAVLERDHRRKDQIEIKKATLQSHQERLSLITQQYLRIEKLLAQSDRCEASLQKTRLELAAIKAQSSDTDVGTVTNSLQQTIDQAKAVQTELQDLGF